MRPLAKTALYFFVLPIMILFSRSGYGQHKPFHFVHKDTLSYHKPPVPTARWILSFNSFGIMEPPAAIGLGIGFRPFREIELWSETSFLFNGFYRTDGPLTGIRQICQLKFFPYEGSGLFVAGELRYKSFQYRNRNTFIDSVARDTLNNLSNFQRHYFYGMAMQIGWRGSLTEDSRWQLEVSCGFGIRKGYVRREGVPAGYSYLNNKIDFNFSGPNGEVPPLYLPGSLRVIRLLGRRKELRPLFKKQVLP
jgi:hypothetical protein